ncbi:HAMP domain-containing sensor histidine kinase [Hahella ganghwensis]|uniref:HAMP domain-containing sensor histidine kinase n=1 Tax=Hahella ganghwensis TaxID=286420 RepID=UPI0003754381|nr:HAMP domain-containing sensor histidine kinase [Hahella ganghwensis]
MSRILRFLQPQTVWQLVVMALMVVVTPLAWLLYSTAISLQTLTIDSREVTQESVTLAESGRSARAALIDMERIARQFVVLEDKALLDLYHTSAESLLTPLHTIEDLLRSHRAGQLIKDIEKAEATLSRSLQNDSPKSKTLAENLANLGTIQNKLDQLITLTRQHTESLLGALGTKASDVRQNVFQSALFLVPITLLLIALFTVLIVRPIRHLRLAIRRLGTGQQRQIQLFGPSELVQLAEELNSLQQRLTQVEEQKQQFLRHVSHELKTPLASIREGTSLLQDELVGELSLQQKEVIRLVDENGKYLQKLIENLLQFNRLNFDTQNRQKSPANQDENSLPADLPAFDLNDLVTHTTQQHWLALSQSGQKICIGGPQVSPNCHREKLHAALDNLISNAIAYGRRRGKIWVVWSINNDHLVIDVRNEGSPIPPSEAEYIFEPFFQGSAKRSGAVKGSGIGLSVARESIQSLDGELRLAENKLDSICFSICLPGLTKDVNFANRTSVKGIS